MADVLPPPMKRSLTGPRKKRSKPCNTLSLQQGYTYDLTKSPDENDTHKSFVIVFGKRPLHRLINDHSYVIGSRKFLPSYSVGTNSNNSRQESFETTGSPSSDHWFSCAEFCSKTEGVDNIECANEINLAQEPLLSSPHTFVPNFVLHPKDDERQVVHQEESTKNAFSNTTQVLHKIGDCSSAATFVNSKIEKRRESSLRKNTDLQALSRLEKTHDDGIASRHIQQIATEQTVVEAVGQRGFSTERQAFREKLNLSTMNANVDRAHKIGTPMKTSPITQDGTNLENTRAKDMNNEVYNAAFPLYGFAWFQHIVARSKHKDALLLAQSEDILQGSETKVSDHMPGSALNTDESRFVKNHCDDLQLDTPKNHHKNVQGSTSLEASNAERDGKKVAHNLNIIVPHVTVFDNLHVSESAINLNTNLQQCLEQFAQEQSQALTNEILQKVGEIILQTSRSGTTRQGAYSNEHAALIGPLESETNRYLADANVASTTLQAPLSVNTTLCTLQENVQKATENTGPVACKECDVDCISNDDTFRLTMCPSDSKISEDELLTAVVPPDLNNYRTEPTLNASHMIISGERATDSTATTHSKTLPIHIAKVANVHPANGLRRNHNIIQSLISPLLSCSEQPPSCYGQGSDLLDGCDVRTEHIRGRVFPQFNPSTTINELAEMRDSNATPYEPTRDNQHSRDGSDNPCGRLFRLGSSVDRDYCNGPIPNDYTLLHFAEQQARNIIDEFLSVMKECYSEAILCNRFIEDFPQDANNGERLLHGETLGEDSVSYYTELRADHPTFLAADGEALVDEGKKQAVSEKVVVECPKTSKDTVNVNDFHQTNTEETSGTSAKYNDTETAAPASILTGKLCLEKSFEKATSTDQHSRLVDVEGSKVYQNLASCKLIEKTTEAKTVQWAPLPFDSSCNNDQQINKNRNSKPENITKLQAENCKLHASNAFNEPRGRRKSLLQYVASTYTPIYNLPGPSLENSLNNGAQTLFMATVGPVVEFSALVFVYIAFVVILFLGMSAEALIYLWGLFFNFVWPSAMQRIRQELPAFYRERALATKLEKPVVLSRNAGVVKKRKRVAVGQKNTTTESFKELCNENAVDSCKSTSVTAQQSSVEGRRMQVHNVDAKLNTAPVKIATLPFDLHVSNEPLPSPRELTTDYHEDTSLCIFYINGKPTRVAIKFTTTVYELAGVDESLDKTMLADLERVLGNETENVICCEVVLAIPADGDNRLLSRLRSLIDIKLLQAKWRLCGALLMDEAPELFLQTSQKRLEENTLMWMYRKYCTDLVQMVEKKAAAMRRHTWRFDLARPPWEELQNRFTIDKLTSGSIGVVHLISLSVSAGSLTEKLRQLSASSLHSKKV